MGLHHQTPRGQQDAGPQERQEAPAAGQEPDRGNAARQDRLRGDPADPAPPRTVRALASIAPLTAGGIDIREVLPDRLADLEACMQCTAEQRRQQTQDSLLAPDALEDWATDQFTPDAASIRGSGVWSRVERFVRDARNLQRGSTDFGWTDDNGRSAMTNSRDYAMRVTIVGFDHKHAQPTGRTGTHGSTAGGGTSGHLEEDRSQSEGTSLEGGLEGERGNLTASAGASVEQGREEATGVQEGTTGSERFERGSEPWTEYVADCVCRFNIAFQPGRTLGGSGADMQAQNFDGSAVFGTVRFQRTDS